MYIRKRLNIHVQEKYWKETHTCFYFLKLPQQFSLKKNVARTTCLGIVLVGEVQEKGKEAKMGDLVVIFLIT